MASYKKLTVDFCLFVRFVFFFKLSLLLALGVVETATLLPFGFFFLQNCNFLMQDPLEKWAGRLILCIEVEMCSRF